MLFGLKPIRGQFLAAAMKKESKGTPWMRQAAEECYYALNRTAGSSLNLQAVLAVLNAGEYNPECRPQV